MLHYLTETRWSPLLCRYFLLEFKMFKTVRVSAYLGVCLFFTVAFYANETFAERKYSLQEINQIRYQSGYPPLTGNRQADFVQLSRECNEGDQVSCSFLPRQQSQQPQYQPGYNPERNVPPPLYQGGQSYRYQSPGSGEQIPPIPPLPGYVPGSQYQQPQYNQGIAPLPGIDPNQSPAIDSYQREKQYENRQRAIQEQQEIMRREAEGQNYQNQFPRFDRSYP